MAASLEEQRFGDFADQISHIVKGDLDPETVDIEFVNTCLTRLRAIERLKPNPPSIKSAACLRDEIDDQFRKHLGVVTWSEQERTAHYDKLVGVLDDFLESGRTSTSGLEEVGVFFRLIIAGFSNYRAKMRA